MARFNLDDYETVESRIKRFYEAYPDGRIITEWYNRNDWGDSSDRKPPHNWVVKASIYLSAGDQANGLAKATGFAQETDGTGGANNVDALANAETSAIGRSLANMAMSGNKRASREEMQKVVVQTDWLAKADKLSEVQPLRLLWAEAKAANADSEILDRIKERANAVSGDGSVSGGTEGSLPGLFGSDAQSSAAGTTSGRASVKAGK